ncbi:MAG: hypothetical protein HYS08_05195 [Chlamydiae bacterium]|nr:hypothetical protein [Chlamydiota bacterium]MBI3266751.1 hypothetical protein [Chlamydiota bacterium]
MKMRCQCKGEYKEQVTHFEGLKSEAMVCQSCGDEILTLKQAEKLYKLKELRNLFRKGRKTIKIGNALGITFPKEFLGREGRPVKISALDPHTVKVQVG